LASSVWYSFAREAAEIQPLVPALKSWWMKLHVPANFIGYGTFSLAAMVAFAYLIKQQAAETRWHRLTPLVGAGRVPLVLPMVFRKSMETSSNYWLGYFTGVGADRGRHPVRPPAHRRAPACPGSAGRRDVQVHRGRLRVLHHRHRAGALWAAEAWGGYWSWDPKETWALIVWLNYAAWLHMRLMKGLRGTVSAWWALVGLAVTTFAFLGVNMFLSGLHSYGEL
jgi:ABC-type transport system involved in cytochrome c biogenesis permease subunit